MINNKIIRDIDAIKSKVDGNSADVQFPIPKLFTSRFGDEVKLSKDFSKHNG